MAVPMSGKQLRDLPPGCIPTPGVKQWSVSVNYILNKCWLAHSQAGSIGGTTRQEVEAGQWEQDNFGKKKSIPLPSWSSHRQQAGAWISSPWPVIPGYLRRLHRYKGKLSSWRSCTDTNHTRWKNRLLRHCHYPHLLEEQMSKCQHKNTFNKCKSNMGLIVILQQ